jgi:hypothetical protein
VFGEQSAYRDEPIVVSEARDVGLYRGGGLQSIRVSEIKFRGELKIE